MVEEGNTDTAPYGLGTYGSRSTPVAGAAIAMAARKIKAKAQMIAAYKLEVHEGDLEWDIDASASRASRRNSMSMKEHRLGGLQFGAAGHGAGPGGGQLLRSAQHDLSVRRLYLRDDIDVDTGVYKIRRFYALDDCGTRINPMIIEGQVHGGLTEALRSRWARRSATTTKAMW
jgi:carbon-monoxide dehydrogenase large subunit